MLAATAKVRRHMRFSSRRLFSLAAKSVGCVPTEKSVEEHLGSRAKHVIKRHASLFHGEELRCFALALLIGPPHFLAHDFFEVVIPLDITHCRNVGVEVTKQKVDSA